MCAAFLIPFGQTLGEAGAGISAGQGVAADLKAKQLANQATEAQLNQYLKQQALLPGALKALFGPKGDALMALGDPGIKMAVQQYMDQMSLQQQVTGLRNEAAQLRASGDTTRADQLDQMANMIGMQVPGGLAGQLSGAVKSDAQQIGDAIGVQLKGGALDKVNDERMGRWQGARDAYLYGLPGATDPGPPPAPITAPSTAGFGGFPTPGMGGGPPAPSTPGGSGSLAQQLAQTTDPNQRDQIIAKALNVPLPIADKVRMGVYGGVPAGAPAPAPAATAPVPLSSRSLEEVVAAEGSPSKQVAAFAKAEERRRNKMMISPKDRAFVDQTRAAQKAASVLVQAARDLGTVNIADFKAAAIDYSTGGWGIFSRGGKGMNPRYQKFFTAMGNVYWNLWNAGNASKTGGGGGLGLLNKLSIHFPHGADNYFPDAPSQAVEKVSQLLLDKDTSSLISHKDELLHRQWRAEHGDAMPYLTPDEWDFLQRHRK